MMLTGKQKRALRGLAHDLEPVVHVGKTGLTDELVAQIARALDAHELQRAAAEVLIEEDRSVARVEDR